MLLQFTDSRLILCIATKESGDFFRRADAVKWRILQNSGFFQGNAFIHLFIQQRIQYILAFFTISAQMAILLYAAGALFAGHGGAVVGNMQD